MKKIIIFSLGLIAIAGIATAVYSVNRNQPKTKEEKFFQEFELAGEREKRPVFEKYINELGPTTMLDILESHYPGCHSQAHELGRTIFAQTKNIEESFTTCSTRCSYACFHGVLMEIFADSTAQKDVIHNHPEGTTDHLHVETEDIITKARIVCDDLGNTDDTVKGACVHGLGHGFTLLFPDNLTSALDLCNTIYKDAASRFYCASGVFMQRDLDRGAQDAQSANPLYPCDTFTDIPAACYAFKITRLVYEQNYQDDDIIKLCLSLPTHERRGCFMGYGFHNYIPLLENPELLGELCGTGDTNDKKMCIDGAVLQATLFDQYNLQPACESLTDNELRQWCQDAVVQRVYSYDHSYDLYVQ